MAVTESWFNPQTPMNYSVPQTNMFEGMGGINDTSQSWGNFGNSTGNSPGKVNSSWSALGGKNDDGSTTNGFLMPGLQAVGGLANAWLGFQQQSLAKKQFAFQKSAFTQQYNQQAQSMNTQLADRQAARVDAGGNYQSVGDYMNDNKIQSYGAQPNAQPQVAAQQNQQPQQANYRRLPGVA